MNTKAITILAIIAILLTAFITNPSQKKHADVFIEDVMNNYVEPEMGTDDLATGAVSGIAKMFLSQRVKVKNYYLFSISYIHSKSRNKDLNTGLGLFGQVFPIASEKDWKEYKKKN